MQRFLEKHGRTIVVGYCSLWLAAIGTFRNFGYDLDGDTGVRNVYPYVAEGWGIWYWTARVGIKFDLFFFFWSFVLSAGILMLAFPGKGRHYSKSVSLSILLYLSFWFLFAQTRYGTAVVLIALAIGTSSLWLTILAGVVAFLFHRGISGAVALVVIWLALRKCRHGLIAAIGISALLGWFLYLQADNILLLTAYDNYTSLQNLPAANTPFKYYYDIALLAAWKFTDRKASNDLLILALLFLPTSYFNVFAGRAHEVYAALFLSWMLIGSVPRVVKYLLLAEYVADVGLLAFTSGVFF